MNRNQLEIAVKNEHPENWVSQMSSSKLVRPRTRPGKLEGNGRKAAVMLLVFPRSDNQLYTVLTRRQDTLQHHPGQISLPGGKCEEGESTEQAALREVEEELGVDRNSIDVVGTLNQIYIPPSDFTVTPFVGWLTGEPVFTVQPEEVDQLIRFRIADLFADSASKYSTVESDPKQRKVPWFDIEDHQVWGATAMILDDFAQRLQRVWGD